MSWHAPVNFAETLTVADAVNNLTSPLTFEVLHGEVFGNTFPIYATLEPQTTNAEVIEVTSRSGNFLTATRPSAYAHPGEVLIVCAVAAEYVTELQSAADSLSNDVSTISGDVSALQSAVPLKAPIDSAALTGTPTAPTPPDNDNSTKIATTAYVESAVQNAINENFRMLAESPSGAADGANTLFTLTHIPHPNALFLFRNGIFQTSGSGKDYTILNNFISFSLAPNSGDNIQAIYFY